MEQHNFEAIGLNLHDQRISGTIVTDRRENFSQFFSQNIGLIGLSSSSEHV